MDEKHEYDLTSDNHTCRSVTMSLMLLKQSVQLLEDRVSYVENTLFRSTNGKSLTTRLALTEQSLDRLDDVVRRLEDLEESYRQRQWQLMAAILLSVVGFIFTLLTRLVFRSG